MTIETKGAVVSEVKALGEAGEFEGYASIFGALDRGGDLVEAGAFRESLAVMPAARVKMLWQHDTSEPIGKWAEIREDSRGLYVKGKLLMSAQRGREAYEMLREGIIDSMSIGYQTVDFEAGADFRRRIKRVNLLEVSLVTFPMLESATISSVKALNPRALEQELRAALNLSSGDAVKAVAILKKHLRESEVPAAARDETGALDNLLATLKSARAGLTS